MDIQLNTTVKSSKIESPPQNIKGGNVAVPAAGINTFSREAGIPSAIQDKVLTTPAVRKIAKEIGIDLSSVRGSGPKGRILKEDIIGEGFSRKTPSFPPPQSTKDIKEQASSSNPGNSSISQSAQFAKAGASDQRVPIRGVQRMMVKSMTAALQVSRCLTRLNNGCIK